MRLIDADKLKPDAEWNGWDKQFTCYSKKQIENAPTADIVRCRECIHNVGIRDGVPFWDEDITCDYWESDGLQSYDYCSYGKRADMRGANND